MFEPQRRHHPEEGGPHGFGPGHHHPHHGGRGRGGHPHGGPGGFGGPGGPGGFGGPGGPGGRARRGEARYVLLDALRDGPKHGYEIIKVLEERSSGHYTPGPGTVYPTLQYLEEMGLLRAEQEADRRVYHLTDAGRAELEAQAEALRAFWTRFTAPAASAPAQTEIGFLQEEIEHLGQTIWNGLRSAMYRNDHETIRQARQAIEGCRNEIRRIIAEAENKERSPGP